PDPSWFSPTSAAVVPSDAVRQDTWPALGGAGAPPSSTAYLVTRTEPARVRQHGDGPDTHAHDHPTHRAKGCPRRRRQAVNAHTPQELEWSDLDLRAVNTVRALAMDAVEKSGNGHPGTAMSLAPAAYLLFQKVMRHDPAAPDWVGRDRFVLSVGHSSLTLYIQLYLAGYGVELDDLKALR